MRSARKFRVLMLGWEYPPRFAGGLGKACQGLSQAMAKAGAQVFFVLPTFPEKVSEKHLEVVGALECLVEAGWSPEQAQNPSPRWMEGGAPAPAAVKVGNEITYLRSDAQLLPYASAPTEGISERLRTVINRISTGPAGSISQSAARVSGEGIRVRTLRPSLLKGKNKDKENKKNLVEENSRNNSEIYGKNIWSEVERYCYMVRHLSDTHEVDVVHAHDWMTFPAAFEFHRMTGVPVFLHVHATEYDRSGDNLNHEVFRIERDGFRRANHIFAVSQYTAGVIERLYGINRKKISVIYNAPDEEQGWSLPDLDQLRKPQVVFLGRLTFQKGPDHFLKAAKLVSEANPHARFIFCGTGDMLDKLRDQAFRLGIERSVHFVGFVDPQGVDQILRHSKVLVMPSVSEPFGLVALEAIRCGIPVILSKQSGVREVLHRALQVDFWDHDKLADQILAALRLPGLSQQLVQDGLDQVKLLSWDKSAQLVIDAYQKLLTSTYAQAIGGAHGH